MMSFVRARPLIIINIKLLLQILAYLVHGLWLSLLSSCSDGRNDFSPSLSATGYYRNHRRFASHDHFDFRHMSRRLASLAISWPVAAALGNAPDKEWITNRIRGRCGDAYFLSHPDWKALLMPGDC
jgi:hypothetical protein